MPNTADRLHPLFIFLKVAEIPKCDSRDLTSTQTEEVSLLIFFSQTSHLLVCQVNNWFLLCTLRPPRETSLCVEQLADSELIIIITGVREEAEAKLAGLYCTCELTLQWPWFSDRCWCERPERHSATWYQREQHKQGRWEGPRAPGAPRAPRLQCVSRFEITNWM